MYGQINLLLSTACMHSLDHTLYPPPWQSPPFPLFFQLLSTLIIPKTETMKSSLLIDSHVCIYQTKLKRSLWFFIQPPPVDACQSCCKSTSLDEFLYRINSPLLLEAKYCWFTYAISSAEGANFSLTIVVMVQESNAIRANCLSTPAQFNYLCAADNYCLAVWDAWLMNDIRTCLHLALPHACLSFHRQSSK